MLVDKQDKEYMGKLIEKHGEDYQKVIAIEELSELQKELAKNCRYGHNYNISEILEEMADVYIILEEVAIIFGLDDGQILCKMEEKIEKTLNIEFNNNLKNNKKQRIVFDFDGVIHSYKHGWTGIDSIIDPPTNGIKGLIDKLRSDGYEIVIFSTRSSNSIGLKAMENWLRFYNIEVDDIVSTKPPALMYIDDRAICFDGNVGNLYKSIKKFKSYLERKND